MPDIPEDVMDVADTIWLAVMPDNIDNPIRRRAETETIARALIADTERHRAEVEIIVRNHRLRMRGTL